MPTITHHSDCTEFWHHVKQWMPTVTDFNMCIWLGIHERDLPSSPIARLRLLIKLRDETCRSDWVMRYKISGAIKKECNRARMVKRCYANGPVARKWTR